LHGGDAVTAKTDIRFSSAADISLSAALDAAVISDYFPLLHDFSLRVRKEVCAIIVRLQQKCGSIGCAP